MCYLGSRPILDSRGAIEDVQNKKNKNEKKARIAHGHGMLKNIWRSKELSVKTKIRIFS